jgi:hypothetical protein
MRNTAGQAGAVIRLTATERKDRTALQLIRDTYTCTRGMVASGTDKATLARITRRGWAARDANSEYTDALALTWDGLDYLAVLEETWHD